MLRSITPAAVLTVISNAVALGAAFGLPISNGQREILLSFAGSVTMLVFAIVAAVHVHHVSSAVKLASSPVPHPATTPSEGGGA